MNQKQREFLIKEVEGTYKQQVSKLDDKIPKAPSLNNYLIAAFLDNSITFADIEELKVKMRNTVINMGRDDVLIKRQSGRRWNDDDEEGVYTVNVLAEDLFILPENYKSALKNYEEIKEEIEKEKESLRQKLSTIIMKINIGSDQVLDKLIAQADNLADLNLVNTQLLLTQ